ncbi:RagB/SusD family nutrient uptake outer membrane protein [Pontibacter sp. G13]|uniref:RagB/SusD family nutrient uptake outer membrane protein n=1 Tax=Pontibacter sp. G13 TaxID=3074898 RepID=UPI00288BB134|nr:RagB/SusD family nutrient uptake outer membrane protein [Pontibacter sp. G13]WNJ19657.1 RagB/SusD family nutrient uptake outer membrane protein [Pontibacter sp. G13]
MMLKRISKTVCILILGMVLFTFPSCFDLDEEPFTELPPDGAFQSEGDFVAGIAAVYAQLRPYLWNYFNCSMVSTDALIIPTRGTDWLDGLRWRQLHTHEWNTTHSDIAGAYSDAFQGVARSNLFIENIENTDVIFTNAPREQYLAEARSLRAFYYFQLLDFFGGVPLILESQADYDNPPPRNSAQEIYDFIESEWTSALDDLADHPDVEYGRISKQAVHGMLAKLYLNAEVFVGTEQLANCITQCDEVINSGYFTLANSYYDNFEVDNAGSSENIFAIDYSASTDLGPTNENAMNLQMRTLHYNQLPQTPWNGFCITAEYFNSFDLDNDPRSRILLVGNQIDTVDPVGTGGQVNDRDGNPLVFTPEISSISNAPENEGVRVLKWRVDPERIGESMNNDLILVRYADILLMKAEALNEQGNTGEAVNLVNEIRARPGSTVPPLTAAGQQEFRDALIDERGVEMAWEGHRRRLLIRMDQFTQGTWDFKEVSAETRKLFPIPQVEIDANPNLTQNPGY